MSKQDKQKKQKPKYVDDGHTVYSMEGVGNPHSPFDMGRGSKKQRISVSREERRALIRGAFRAYLPVFAVVVLCFVLAMLLVYAWLK